ncbi:MAG: cytochrome c [Gammaproteobacteria bacterium]|nr:cytochrome c [Gammaproteobacteria bacterium]
MNKTFMGRIASIGAVAALGLTVAGCQGGGEAELEDTPEAQAFLFRQAVMRVIAQKMVPLGGMARGEVPVDEELFTKSATDLETMAGMATEGFMPQGIPSGSRALPAIWENWSDFEQKAQDFQQAAQALADAAESGGFEAAKDLVQPVAQTCGGCHRTYREREE